jgi:Flp pilus assembly protein TadG
LRLDTSGQSLLEAAVCLPVLFVLMAYAVDFGYFFFTACTLTGAARVATEYSVQGDATASQQALPAAYVASSSNGVFAIALADVAELTTSATTTSVQVCSKELGTNGELTNCGAYGASNSTSYTPQEDPEPGSFYLNRVDITYTVHPPIPMSFFHVPLLPTLTFHRFAVMRAMD